MVFCLMGEALNIKYMDHMVFCFMGEALNIKYGP